MNTSPVTLIARAATDEAEEKATASIRCVALRAVVTSDRPDGDVEILTDASTVAIAADRLTIGGLFAAALAETPEQAMVLGELAAVESRTTSGPVILERLLVGADGRAVHLEARVLPLTEHEQRDLQELLGDTAAPDLAREMAVLYAEELQEEWEQRTAAGRLPVCFLDDADFTSGSRHQEP